MYRFNGTQFLLNLNVPLNNMQRDIMETDFFNLHSL